MQDLVIRAAALADLPTVEALARKIWPQAYGSIISAEQIRYMLEKMYNQALLLQQLSEWGYQFLMLEYQGEPAGYASFSLLDEEKNTKLHKFYLDPALHGKGFGKMLMEHVFTGVKASGSTIIRLDVNRRNPAWHFYKRMGFSILREQDTDIGDGFFMIDFVMEKKL